MAQTLNFNGTEMTSVTFNGTEMDRLYFNGTLVFDNTPVGGDPIMRPNSDINLPFGWSGSYTDIDEATVDNSDYLAVTIRNTSTPARFGLTDGVDPGVNTGHVFRFTAQLISGSFGLVSPTIWQGGTQIWQGSFTAMTATETEYSFTLDGGSAGSITDYTDLSLGFFTNGVMFEVRIYQAEFEVPE